MIKRLLVLCLLMGLGTVANAAVVWNWTGGGGTTAWDTAANWSTTDATSYTYPSQQYVGVGTTNTPNYRWINSDVTALSITNGGTVNKTVEDGTTFLSSSWLYLGGDDCTLTLDNSSKLYTGNNFYAGAAVGANTTINLLNGSNLSTNYAYLGNVGTCTVNISGGSSFTPRNGSRLGWAGGTGYMTVDGAGSLYAPSFSLRLGGGDGAHAELTVKNGGAVYTKTELQVGAESGATATTTVDNGSLSSDTYITVGYSGIGSLIVTNGGSASAITTFHAGDQVGSQGTVTVDGGSISAATNGTSYSRVGYNGTATMTVKNNGAFTTGHHLYVGQYGTGTMNVQSGGKVDVGMTLYLGRNASGNGTINIDGTGGSSVTVTGDDIIVGHEGAGAVTVTNGGVFKTNADAMVVAQSNGSTGTLTLDAGSVAGAVGRVYFGESGQGTCNVTDSTLNVGLDLRVGHTATAVGVLNVYGDSVVNVGRDFETFIGGGTVTSPDKGKALVHVLDGDMNINGYCSLGHATTGGSYTEFTVDDGVVDIGLAPSSLGDLILGWYDTDANVDVLLNGGVMTVGGAIYMGRATNAVGDTITPTGSDTGQLRINIAGGILQAEDYVVAGTISDSLLTLTAGYLRINRAAVSEGDMAALVGLGDISCPNGYVIYTDGNYTVLTIPEPTTMSLVLLGLGCLALVHRKRRT